MPYVFLNGVQLYYEEEGEGEPLLFIHGLAGDLFMYEREMSTLKEDFRVIALDSRGHGKSEKPSDYTLQDHVEDVIHLLDHLKIERVHLLGTSMGSYIAQGLAICAPERVHKLILVSAKAHGQTSSVARLFKQYASEVQGMTFDEKADYLSKYIFHQLEAVKAFKAEMERKRVQLTPKQQAAATKALEGFDFRDDLHKITAETLVISGQHDGLNPPEDGREIAKLIPRSIFVMFESSGHLPNTEEPDCFMETIRTFLKK